MKFNLDVTPEPIQVRIGDEEFTLQHRYMSASERAASVEAIGRSLGLAFTIVMDFITGWMGVTKLDGTPISFSKQGEDGKLGNNLNAVLGRLPWMEQLKILFKVYAANGVRFARIRSLISDYVDDPRQLEEIAKELAPLASPSGGGPGTQSAS